MSGELESVAIVGVTHCFESFCHAFCIAVFTAGLTLLQPVTGFQVVSVHSILDLDILEVS